MTKRPAASGTLGKTECWYVVHAKLGAQIALGLKAGVTRDEFGKAIQAKKPKICSLDEYLCRRNDLRCRRDGTHIRPGSILLETQQQSDTTYRLYDYGRPRELHLERGLAAVKEKVASGKVIKPRRRIETAIRAGMRNWSLHHILP